MSTVFRRRPCFLPWCFWWDCFVCCLLVPSERLGKLNQTPSELAVTFQTKVEAVLPRFNGRAWIRVISTIMCVFFLYYPCQWASPTSALGGQEVFAGICHITSTFGHRACCHSPKTCNHPQGCRLDFGGTAWFTSVSLSLKLSCTLGLLCQIRPICVGCFYPRYLFISLVRTNNES